MFKESKASNLATSGGSLLLTFGLIVSIAALALLALASFPISWTNNLHLGVTETLTISIQFARGLGIFVAVLGMFVILSFLVRLVTTKKRLYILTALICLVTIAFQLWWVVVQGAESSYFSDSNQLMIYAKDLAAGTFINFDKSPMPINEMAPGTLYFVNYPYQCGILFYFVQIVKLFNDYAPTVIQLVNIFGNTLTYCGLCFLSGQIDGRLDHRAWSCILLGLAFPMYLYSTMFYGNQIGLGFAVTFVSLNVFAMNEPRKFRAAFAVTISLIPLTISLVLKSTYLVIALGVVVLWFVHALKSHSLRLGGITSLLLIVILISSSLANAPVAWLESSLGYSIGSGIPKTAWIAMGLQDDSVLGPTMHGWWNPFPNNIQIETGNDYDEMSDLSKREIVDRVTTFVHNPKYAFSFFSKKVTSEWLNPDFQAMYFNAINYRNHDGDEHACYTYVNDDDMLIPDCETSAMSAWGVIEFLSPFFDVFQSYVYSFSLVAALAIFKLRKNYSIPQLASLCLFIVGVVLYTFWEAKAQYCLPFFLFLIPTSAYGCAILEDFVSNHTPCYKCANNRKAL